MWSKLHPRFFAWGLIVLTSLLLFVRYPAAPVSGVVPGDFGVYFQASQRVQKGESTYRHADAAPAYKFSPGVLAPMQLLPSEPAKAWFWYGTLCVVLFGVALLVSGTYSTWRDVELLFIGLLISWKGILETFDYGQLEVFLLSLALISAALLNRWALVSGLIAGFLPWIKLPWVLLLLPFMTAATVRTERRGRLFFSGYLASCFTWGAAVPSLLYGSERAKLLSQDWLGVLRTVPSAVYQSDANQSIWFSAIRWFGQELLPSSGLAGLALGLILGLLMARASDPGIYRKTPALAWISPWLVFTQLLTPLAWTWGSVFLIGMPMTAGWSAWNSQPDETGDSLRVQKNLRFSIVAIIALLWMLQQNPVASSLGFGHWSDFHGVGLLTAYWLSMLVLTLL